MASGVIVLPGFMPVVDANGERVAGAKAYFYLNGTGTLAASVYSDAGLTALLPNPVEADSLGVWPAMWADTANLYTVALTDEDGVPLSGGAWSGLGPAIDATAASVALAASYADIAEAAAASALGSESTYSTSATNLAIGLGARTFVITELDQIYWRGQRIVAASHANPANQFSGIVTDWVPGTRSLTAAMDTVGVGAAGAHADWDISLTGFGAVSSVAGLVGAIAAATLKAALALDQVQNFATVGRQALPILASSIKPRNTNGAAPGVSESAVNKRMSSTLDFDPNTPEYGQFTIPMPPSWDEGNVTAKFVWSHGATATNFKASWALSGVAMSDGDAGDAAQGVAQIVNDTGGVTDTIYISPETAAITIAGAPATADLVTFEVKRVATDAVNDTLGVDARLIAVILFYNTAAVLDT